MSFRPAVERIGYDTGHSAGRALGREEGRREGFQRGLKDGRREGREIGRSEGHRAGRQEGRREGLQAGALALVEVQLRRRFGPLPERTRERIAGLSPAGLESLAEGLLDFDSADALERWLGHR